MQIFPARQRRLINHFWNHEVPSICLAGSLQYDCHELSYDSVIERDYIYLVTTTWQQPKSVRMRIHASLYVYEYTTMI